MALRWFKKKTESENKIVDQPPTPEKDQAASDAPKRLGFVKRLRKGLAKTRKILTTDIDKLFVGKRNIDDDLLEKLEELLITADIGVQTTMELIERISKKALAIAGADELKAVLKEEILSYLPSDSSETQKVFSKPHVVMVLGVNGVGKTTTIGKLAARSVADGKKVLIAAADTFRAAAVEQLTIWAERAGAEIVKHKGNADPAAVAYDCVEAAVARGADLVFIDTAGRLHTRVNLMEELKKIKRTISNKLPDAPHEILLVLDATTGQNALSQAQLFNEALEVTGIALTKLDGTAKGGIVVSICSTLKIALKYIGVGEHIEDLQDFDPIQFVNALF
jgi:fused signal recognition particle receptor